MKILRWSLVSLLLVVTFISSQIPAYASDAAHKVAIHVDSSDPDLINMALNNVANLRKYYDSVGESVTIEVVAYGPGLHMLRADTSPVANRIAAMSLEIDDLTFSACGNTHAKMSKKAGKSVTLIDEATMVPSGVVQLITLQEQGYSYIRP